MSSDESILKCDELCYYAKNVLSKMNMLRESGGHLCDVMLRVSGVDFPAHKVVLAASCDYFAAMFSCGMSESQLLTNSTAANSGQNDAENMKPVTLPVIELGPPLSSPPIMQILLEFMYSGLSGIHINKDNVQELLPAAAVLHLDTLKQACAFYLLQQLEASNVLGIRRFAELHHCPQLYACAQEFVGQHFDAVCLQEEWLALSMSEVVALLEREDLQTQSEEQVYEAVMRWVSHDVNDRTQYLPQLLRHVRMCVLSAKYLTDVVDIDPQIRRIHACRDLVDDAKRYHLRPDQRNTLAAQDVRFRPRAGLVEHLVVIAGFGADQVPTDSVEIFSPETGEWCDLPSLPKRYRYVSACALGSCIYTIGGFDGRERLNAVAVLDVGAALGYVASSTEAQASSGKETGSLSPRTAAQWRWLTPMHHRRGLAASCTYQDRVYVAGGFDGVNRLRSLEVYHPKIDEWHLLEDMDVCREGAGLVVVNDTLYALGGYNGECLLNSMECYFLSPNHGSNASDPSTNASQDTIFQQGNASPNVWRPCPNMHMRRSGAGCAVMGDCILVCGGFGGADGLSPMHLPHVESYDTRFGQWTMVKNMNVPRCYVGAACLANKVYVAAGYDGTSLLDSLEAYDPVENQWTLFNDRRMRHERCDTGMCVVKLRMRRCNNNSMSSYLMASSSSFRQLPSHTQSASLHSISHTGNASATMAGTSITTVIGSPLWSQQQQQRYASTQASIANSHSINVSNQREAPISVVNTGTNTTPMSNPMLHVASLHSSANNVARTPEGDGGPPADRGGVQSIAMGDDVFSTSIRSTEAAMNIPSLSLQYIDAESGDVPSTAATVPTDEEETEVNESSESENDWNNMHYTYRQFS